MMDTCAGGSSVLVVSTLWTQTGRGDAILSFARGCRDLGIRCQVLLDGGRGDAGHWLSAYGIGAVGVRGLSRRFADCLRGDPAAAVARHARALGAPLVIAADTMAWWAAWAAMLHGGTAPRAWPGGLLLPVPEHVRGLPRARFSPRAAEQGGGAPVIGVVSRLVRGRGVPDVLAAVASLPGFRLRVAGTGEAERELRSVAARLGVMPSVSWFGRIGKPGLAAFYRSIDAAVVWRAGRDGFGRAALEALWCGTPVVLGPATEAARHLAGWPGVRVAKTQTAAALTEALRGIGTANPAEREAIAAACRKQTPTPAAFAREVLRHAAAAAPARAQREKEWGIQSQLTNPAAAVIWRV